MQKIVFGLVWLTLVTTGSMASAQTGTACCGTIASPSAPSYVANIYTSSAPRVYGVTPVVGEYYYPYSTATYGGAGSAAYFTGSPIPGIGYTRAWVGDAVHNWQHWHYGYPPYAGSINPYFMAYGYRPTVSTLYASPWALYHGGPYHVPHVPYSYPHYGYGHYGYGHYGHGYYPIR